MRAPDGFGAGGSAEARHPRAALNDILPTNNDPREINRCVPPKAPFVPQLVHVELIVLLHRDTHLGEVQFL